MTDEPTAKPKFPATFWTANTIELFERAAYYSMASFMVIYLKESLGMTPSAAASIIGGPIGGRLFERYINTPLKEGRPVDTVTMWLIIVVIGIASVIGLAVYDRIVVKGKKG